MPVRNDDGEHHRLVGVRDHHSDAAAEIERRPAGQQVVGDRAQRVDVAPLIEVPVAQGLLRRHEHRGAEDAALAGPVGLAGLRHGENQSEIEQLGHVLHLAAAGREDVRRLDVAMDQPGRMRLRNAMQTCRSR